MIWFLYVYVKNEDHSTFIYLCVLFECAFTYSYKTLINGWVKQGPQNMGNQGKVLKGDKAESLVMIVHDLIFLHEFQQNIWNNKGLMFFMTNPNKINW